MELELEELGIAPALMTTDTAYVPDLSITVKRDGVKTSVTCKKVFVTLLDNGYTFRKKKTWGKRELGNFRAQFVCTECDKMNVFFECLLFCVRFGL